jgi:hypothetical protein
MACYLRIYKRLSRTYITNTRTLSSAKQRQLAKLQSDVRFFIFSICQMLLCQSLFFAIATAR